MDKDDVQLMEIEPEALRAAEFMQAAEVLATMPGKRITAARLEETRIAIETEDGTVYFFYGFMGEEKPQAS